MEYYLKSSEDTLRSLNTTSDGLTGEEAARRLAKNGKNKLAEPEKDSLAKRFLKTIADPMILLLIAAAAVQALVTVLETTGKPTLGDFTDVIVILAVVILNATMSIIQENKASAAMEALMQMTALTSKVLRDGKVEVVKSEDLVVGDVLVLEAGDAVPADCRVLESYSMKAEESFLTGESNPVSKVVDMLMCTEGKKVPLGDRENMLFSGSTVVYGRGRAVITGCGMDTEMGKIADALSQAEDEKTPLQIKLTELSAFLTKLVLGICALVFIIGLAEGLIFATEPFSVKLLGSVGINTFVAAIALAVAAIPEGLPAVVTILLSIGVTRMANRQALVRKLTAV
ncbi:MAG: HAD-IC family P-type ATPase, partial [Verrucomicrobia bacterium]|nr:HAD-IC family P-type ATPase [Verrucomicrobiota bacterium]